MFNEKDYSTKLLGLQGVIIENIEENNGTIEISVRMERKTHKCPNCGKETNKIHDYRKQIITDLDLYEKPTKIHLKKKKICMSALHEKVLRKYSLSSQIFSQNHESYREYNNRFKEICFFFLCSKKTSPINQHGNKNFRCDFLQRKTHAKSVVD